jgi:hypothetical protein
MERKLELELVRARGVVVRSKQVEATEASKS